MCVLRRAPFPPRWRCGRWLNRPGDRSWWPFSPKILFLHLEVLMHIIWLGGWMWTEHEGLSPSACLRAGLGRSGPGWGYSARFGRLARRRWDQILEVQLFSKKLYWKGGCDVVANVSTLLRCILSFFSYSCVFLSFASEKLLFFAYPLPCVSCRVAFFAFFFIIIIIKKKLETPNKYKKQKSQSQPKNLFKQKHPADGKRVQKKKLSR